MLGGIQMLRTREQAEQTRNLVLKAASELFVEKGFTNISITEIAEKIAATKGAVYWHFKNKDEILLAIISEDCGEAVKEATAAIIDPESGESLYSYYRKIISDNSSVERRERLHRLINQSDCWPCELKQKAKQLIEKALEDERRLVISSISGAQAEGKIRSDVDPEKVGLVISTVISGLRLLRAKGMLASEFSRYDRLMFEAFRQTLQPLYL